MDNCADPRHWYVDDGGYLDAPQRQVLALPLTEQTKEMNAIGVGNSQCWNFRLCTGSGDVAVE